MLTAIKDNQTIFVQQHPASLLKEWSNSKSLLCPDCKDVLIFKECLHKESHFAHVSKDCSFPFREPESIEHEKGKSFLYNWLINQFGDSSCEIEKHIVETNQRSDTFISEYRTAVEYQCSPIQMHTWEKRHQLYQEANVKDFWILGYSMHKYKNKNNPFIHKLNQLEQTLLKEYGRIFYFDVLTEYFVVLQPQTVQQNLLYGEEFFFKSSECNFDTDNQTLNIKYNFFLNMQSKRRNYLAQKANNSKETNEYIEKNKLKSTGEKILASKKQTNYIQLLLTQQNMTVPYKLNGLLKHEAAVIIKELLAAQKKEVQQH